MNIRTKILSGYLLFTLLILSFLGLNYYFEISTLSDAKEIYQTSEDIRLEMEMSNLFWRQVVSRTDYFLNGEAKHRADFLAYQKLVLNHLALIEPSLDNDAERDVLRQVKDNYGQFTGKFDNAAELFQTGKKEEAKQLEASDVDPAEAQVELAIGRLLELKRAEISLDVGQINADKNYARFIPSLKTPIEKSEAIQAESRSLQNSLDAEADFLKQKRAFTELLLSNQNDRLDQFRRYGDSFQALIQQEKVNAQSDAEKNQLDLVQTNHLAFTDAFNLAVHDYETGDRRDAVRIDDKTVGPAEDQVSVALDAFFPLKQQRMKRALEDLDLVDGSTRSITEYLGISLGITLIIGFLVGSISAIRITRPLRRLVGATDNLAAGDFGVRLAETSRDEVGQLAGSFNRMAETLQRTTVSKHYVDGILQSMGDSLVVTSSAKLILTVNAATCRMLGYEESELVGEPLELLFAPDSATSGGSVCGALGGSEPVNDLECIYLTKDGRHIPVSFSRAALRLDSSRLQGFVCVAKDISERHRAEQALRGSEQKLSLHIEQTPLAVIEWDLHAKVVEWNPAAEIVFGYTRAEAIGRQMAELLVPESTKDASERSWQELISHQGGRHTINENLTKDGRTIVCDWYNTALNTEGRVIGVASMVQDFTERIQMEAALKLARDSAVESARLKSEFLANMSHEIRTPMNGVIGMTGLLIDTDLTAEQRAFAETIRTSGEALLTIINDILDFSKIEAGKLQFESLDFDLSQTIESTIELLAERAREKNLELGLLVLNNVPTELRGDPGRLRQILMNLISNAIKFTERGEVTVRVELDHEVNSDVVIRFSVSDTGIGISPALQANLFQSFTQADGSTTRKYGGTGLGLAISKQLVELMGGKIGIVSEAGHGSTFWFTAKFQKLPSGSITPPRNASSLSRMRALIVDDNATNREILSHQLGSWGLPYEPVASGADALDLLRSAAAQGRAFDLAILDLKMPEMDGIDLARNIKSDPVLAHMRLVLLTSIGQLGHATTAREIGVAACLTKPVRQAQLLDCLTKVLGQVPAIPDQQIASALPPTDPTEFAGSHPLLRRLILLAEDNAVNQKVAAGQLRKLGYRADAVANGLEAIEALERIPYDLVLMDCQMPQLDGYAATTEIRRREANGVHIPIVAMTANAMEGERKKCLAAGMDEYISKPVKLDELRDLLERLLDKPGRLREKRILRAPAAAGPSGIVR